VLRRPEAVLVIAVLCLCGVALPRLSLDLGELAARGPALGMADPADLPVDASGDLYSALVSLRHCIRTGLEARSVVQQLDSAAGADRDDLAVRTAEGAGPRRRPDGRTRRHT
jgi:hypothetical protein